MQVCDSQNWQSNDRVCGNDRTLLSKKSLRSFFSSVQHCLQSRPHCEFAITLIHDRISPDLYRWLQDIVQRVSNDGIVVSLQDLAPQQGISNSIRACYQWMRQHGSGIVGQFQDDYIFEINAILDCVDMIQNMRQNAQTDAIISHCHDSWPWKEQYLNRSTPRALMLGSTDYWIQIYDLSCSWLTTHEQFCRHWDLYEIFFELCNQDLETLRQNNNLENNSLNLMTTRRGVLALNPMRTLSHHVQNSQRLDPYVDWKILWDSINIEV